MRARYYAGPGLLDIASRGCSGQLVHEQFSRAAPWLNACCTSETLFLKFIRDTAFCRTGSDRPAGDGSVGHLQWVRHVDQGKAAAIVPTEPRERVITRNHGPSLQVAQEGGLCRAARFGFKSGRHDVIHRGDPANEPLVVQGVEKPHPIRPGIVRAIRPNRWPSVSAEGRSDLAIYRCLLRCVSTSCQAVKSRKIRPDFRVLGAGLFNLRSVQKCAGKIDDKIQRMVRLHQASREMFRPRRVWTIIVTLRRDA